VAGGLTLGPRWLLCTGEVRYTSWEEIEGVPLSGPHAKDYESQLGAGVAVELHTPGLPLRLRAGFAHDPVPYQLHLGNPARQACERRRYAVGAGLLVEGRFALDAALVRAEFERADTLYGQVFEARVEEQAHLSAAYRF
jgi:hypothetical protein